MKYQFLRSVLFAFAWMLMGAVALPLPTVFAQDGDAKKATAEKQEEKNEGEKELSEALELSQKAKTNRDLDRVATKLESAIKKGLDDDSKKLAENLLKSTYMKYAKAYSAQIFKIPRDNRWPFFRREALSRLRDLVKLDPENADALLMIAKLQVLPDGDRKEATEAIEKAAKIAKDDKTKLAEILLIRAALAKDDDARLADLNKALEGDPKNIRALNMRALYYQQLYAKQKDKKNKDNLKKAIADWETLSAIQPDNQGLQQRLIAAYSETEEHGKAVKIIDKMLEAQDDNPQLYALKAEKLADMKKFDEAIKAIETAIEFDDSNVPVLLVQCRILLQAEKFPEAVDVADNALEIQPQAPGALYLRSIAFSSQEKWDEAIEDMETLCELLPQNQEFKLQLGSLYSAADKFSEALEIFNDALDENDENVQALRGRGDVYLGMGKHKKAIRDYNKLLEVDKENSGAMNNLAWVLSTTPIDELRDGKRAVELSLKACELTEYKLAHILSTLASSYAETDDFENALKWGKKAVEMGEKEKSSQLDDLKKEVEAYQEKKKWREYKEQNGAEGDVEFDIDE